MNIFALSLALCLLPPDDGPGPERATVVVVVGSPGSADYEVQFRQWADRWKQAAAKGSARFEAIGLDRPAEGTDRDRLRAALADAGPGPLWLVLIGHGTFDGREAKFNLRGPDVTDAELAAWLGSTPAKPLAVLDCTSSSGTFLPRLSGEGRVVVTATKSGQEQNFARFGEYLARAIGDPGADGDKDGQVSLLEAFLAASRDVAEFYKGKSRLATEHALIDDNGDKLGTPADWFRGVRATRKAKDGATADGVRAHQVHLVPGDRERALTPEARRRRDEIEVAVAALRDRKSTLPPAEYYRQLEPLMLDLARIYAGPAGQAGDGKTRD